MTAEADVIRAALLRRSLADARRRALVAASLRLTDTEVLAIQHLASAGPLAIGDLQRRIALTSGGATALVQRLERSGHVVRRAHPRDRRSSVLTLTAASERALAEWQAPLGADVEAAVAALDPGARAAVARCLERIADAEERRVEQLADRAAQPDAALDDLVAPGRWA